MSKHLIKIAATPHGVLSAKHEGADQQYCESGETVILEWQPDDKWGLEQAFFVDSNGNKVFIDIEAKTFTMPASDIEIDGVFKRFVIQDWTGYLEQLGFSEFDSSASYSDGDIVVYNGTLYIFTSDHSGAWTGDDVESLTMAEIVEMLSHQNDVYGVSYDESLSSTAKPRVGNMALHQSLPIQSGMKRCVVKDDGTVNYYLDANDSTLKADGTAADLTGEDGQVMVEIPEHWRKVTKTDGGVVTALISAYWQQGWKHVPTYYVGAYQATVDTTLATKNKLCSVANTTNAFRGGSNDSSWDGTYRDQRGTPRTGLTMANYRTYARNRGSKAWNFLLYDLYIDIYWLYVIEYANTNSQANFDSSLTSEGYHQGGLGAGASTLDSTKWNNFNNRNPFLQCGITNTLGNNSGEVTYTMPDEYDTGNTVTIKVCSYRGIENVFGQIYHWLEGVKINDDKTYRCSNVDDFSSAASQGNYYLEGNKVASDGYVKQMFIGKDGSIMPTAVGGGTTTYYADYHYRANAGLTTWYGVAVGGGANFGANAGLACVYAYTSVSYSSASFGARLCFSKALL